MIDLYRAWQSAWNGLGLATPDRALFDELLRCYDEPQRKYHNRKHLQECLEQFAGLEATVDQPGEIALALWFHDAIYDIGRADNEARSAAWAQAEILANGGDEALAWRVHELVMATRHSSLPDTVAAQALVDIDLSILGAEPARFDEYEQQIRAEYADIPEPLFLGKRLELVETFLHRERIYSTSLFQARYESRARENLLRSASGARRLLQL